MTFFTVRATLVGGETGASGWRFGDRRLAEAKFREVCGPLCTEAWLLRWTDVPSIRGKKEVYIELHWTFRAGVDSAQELLTTVHVLEDSETSLDLADQGARVLAAVDNADRVSDISLELVRSPSVHNLREIEIDFDAPPDDSHILVFVAPERITADRASCDLELSFVKVSPRLKVSPPDVASPFSGLRLRCQWNAGGDWADDEVTYGWSTDYRDVGTVDLKRAECMIQMLRKIREIEATFPFKPKSFGEYVVVMAQRIGLNPDSIGCIENQNSAEPLTRYGNKCVCLSSIELRITIDEAIARWIQSHSHPRKHRVFVVSDEPAIIEVIPSMFIARGCDAEGSLSLRNGSWAYEKVLREAAEFRPSVLLIFYNCNLCPKVDDLDLPSRLLGQFLFAKVIITRVGETVSVRDEVLEYLERCHRSFHIVDVPFEVDQILSLIQENAGT